MGQVCVEAGECCSDVCEGNKCCGGFGTACERDRECCGGHCDKGLHVCCSPNGSGSCSADGDCCGGQCASGTCCGVAGGTCGDDGDCCGPNTCHAIGGGQRICCRNVGDVCESTRECCFGAFGDNNRCCFKEGDVCTRDDQCCEGECGKDGTCRKCLAEGAQTNNPDKCCSGVARGGVCCSKPNGSCAGSGCCVGDRVCHEGTCVDCLPAGATTDDPLACCSEGALEGRCCGELNGPCIPTGCCVGGQICFGETETCIDCLAEGTHAENPQTCCSRAMSTEPPDGVCCGVAGGSCATSDCCGDLTFCREGNCVACLPEGESAEFGEYCCSGKISGPPRSGAACCGELGGSCSTSGCCAGDDICCKGDCVAACGANEVFNSSTCRCDQVEPRVCQGSGKATGQSCQRNSDCCTNFCKNGECTCQDSRPGESGFLCSRNDQCCLGYLCEQGSGQRFCNVCGCRCPGQGPEFGPPCPAGPNGFDLCCR